MEIAREMGLDHVGEDEDDEEEEEDAEDRGDATTPPTAAPPPPAPPAAALEDINEEGPVEVILEQEAPMPHEVIPQMLSMRYHNSVSTMHDYEENPLRVENDFDDLDDDLSEDHSDMYV
jgi:hypothetical protein